VATVLVVDDRAVNRDLVRTLLGYQGFDVVEAEDGDTALRLARERRPDLMITDIVMPDMNGWELVREIRSDRALAELPVIFYTANYVEQEARPIADSLGVESIVHKTGDLTDLLNAVHAARIDATSTSASPTVTDADFSREHLRLLNEKLVEKVRELEEKERLHTLLDAAVAVTGDLGLHETLGRVAAAARQLVRARYASVRCTEPSGVEGEFADDGEDGDSGQPTGPWIELLIGDREPPCGILRVQGPRDGEFTEADRALLGVLCAAAGTAISNARRFDAAARREAWLAASAEITAAMLHAAPAEALEHVVRGVRRVAGADFAVIQIATNDGHVVVDACDGEGMARFKGLVLTQAQAPLHREVASTGRPVRVHDVASGRPELTWLAPAGISVGPMLAIPLSAPDDACPGALLLGNARGGRSFGDVELEMASTLGAHAAVVLEFRRAGADRQQLALLRERERIARDLHDIVIQRIFATGLTLSAVGADVPAAADRLDDVVRELDETIDDIRSTIFALRMVNAGPGSLPAEVRSVIDKASGVLGFAPRLVLKGPVDVGVPERIVPELLATLREALSNVARHAHASSVVIRLSVSGGELALRVVDNGRGLPAERAESGLANLRHRAGALGGSMTAADRGTPSGCVLEWRIPLHVPDRRPDVPEISR
jgi:signal transduction histidine kinase/CheY-like chemotaxis protein